MYYNNTTIIMLATITPIIYKSKGTAQTALYITLPPMSFKFNFAKHFINVCLMYYNNTTIIMLATITPIIYKSKGTAQTALYITLPPIQM